LQEVFVDPLEAVSCHQCVTGLNIDFVKELASTKVSGALPERLDGFRHSSCEQVSDCRRQAGAENQQEQGSPSSRA
jgi:hypothetical protein